MTGDRTTMMVSIADIAIGDRIGFFHPDHAARFGTEMEAGVWYPPVLVKRNGNAAKQKWTLVAGLHRLRGAEGIGHTEIAAIEVAQAGASAADLRRMELAENLGQKHRRPIERAIMMVEYGKLEEEFDHPGMAGESRQARGGRLKHVASVIVKEAANACATMALASRSDWRSRTAAAFDVSLSQFERHQRIYRDVVEALPDLAQALNDHPFGENLTAMGRIGKIPTISARRKVAETLLSKLDWKSMDEVIVAAKIGMSTGSRVDDRNHQAMLITTWGKMKAPEKRKYLEEQFPDLLSKDMAKKLVIRLVDRFEL